MVKCYFKTYSSILTTNMIRFIIQERSKIHSVNIIYHCLFHIMAMRQKVFIQLFGSI